MNPEIFKSPPVPIATEQLKSEVFKLPMPSTGAHVKRLPIPKPLNQLEASMELGTRPMPTPLEQISREMVETPKPMFLEELQAMASAAVREELPIPKEHRTQ